jgi:hypothetical protein
MTTKPVTPSAAYFEPIEAHWQARNRCNALLTPQDWTLLIRWKQAGIPLAAVLRGIDDTYAAADRKRGFTASGRVNGLAYCQPQVFAAAAALAQAGASTRIEDP